MNGTSTRHFDGSIQARRHRLVRAVRGTLEAAGVDLSEPLTIGLSGGADSIALLIALVVVQSQSTSGSAVHGKLTAVHVHHHLRDDADLDLAHAQSVASRWNVSFVERHVYPAMQDENVAGAARRLRYEALASVAHESGGSAVFVAHHADDQLETMLLALCRGGGVSSSAGMPVVRQLTQFAPPVSIVRPLLHVTAAECQDFCRAAEQDWIDDPTNEKETTARGYLRSKVMLPLLERWPTASRQSSTRAEDLHAMLGVMERGLHAMFGEAATQTWQRQVFHQASADEGRLGLVRCLSQHDIFEINGRVLRDAARAAHDRSTEPRAFHVATGVMIEVNAREVSVVMKQTSNVDCDC